MAELNEQQFKTTGSLDLDLKDELERCHTDPIHHTAFIQPHGTFLEIDPQSMEIHSAAQNVDLFIEPEASALIGQSLDSCFPAPFVNSLKSHLQNRFPERKHFTIEYDSTNLNVYIFPAGDRAGMEIERHPGPDQHTDLLITNLTDQLDHLRGQDHRSTLFNRALESLGSFTNYDRLLVYRFNEEGHGSVVAEQKRENLKSFMGLQFPASDIPEPARRIYRKNTIRIIPNVEYDPVPILGPDGQRNREELDLTYSELRSVPAIHRKYMSNMGVQGSLSLSLIVNNDLWGMIACHSTSPHQLDPSQKSACKQIARTTAQQIEKLIATDRERQYKKITHIRQHIDEALTDYKHLFDQLEQSSKSLRSLMDATVFCLHLDGKSMWLSDKDEDIEYAKQLMDGIRERLSEQDTFAVESLENEWEANWSHSDRISGFYACRLAYTADSFCVWFRPEHRETIDWGGDPRNPVEVSESGELSPRNSFDAWTQIVSSTCRRWTALDRFTADEIGRLLKEMENELQKHLLEKKNQHIEAKNNALEETKKRLRTINEEKEELLDQVREMARRDDLTGLLNRDELEKQLSSEFDRAERYQQDMSVVFLDLDHFKAVNDQYGHQAGDDVLEITGDKLLDISRNTDIIGRYGGEEFIAVLPETDIEHAKSFADRFRNDLRNHTFHTDEGTFQLTCSIGISDYRPTDNDPETIVDRADDALYRAKNSGRDRICIAGETEGRDEQTDS